MTRKEKHEAWMRAARLQLALLQFQNAMALIAYEANVYAK